MNWTFGRKLAAGFAIAVVTLVLIGVSGHRATTDLIETNRWVTHTQEVKRSLVACLWTLPAHHWLLCIVNASWQPSQGSIDAGPLATRDCQFQDYLAGAPPYQVRGDELARNGIQVSLPSWGAVVFRIMPQK